MAEIEPLRKKKRLKSIDEIEAPIFRANWDAIQKKKLPTFLALFTALLAGVFFGLVSLRFF